MSTDLKGVNNEKLIRCASCKNTMLLHSNIEEEEEERIFLAVFGILYYITKY